MRRLARNIGDDMDHWRSPPERAGNGVTGGPYCFQTRNASANTRSPGVPFSMAMMARRLLL